MLLWIDLHGKMRQSWAYSQCWHAAAVGNSHKLRQMEQAFVAYIATVCWTERNLHRNTACYCTNLGCRLSHIQNVR